MTVSEASESAPSADLLAAALSGDAKAYSAVLHWAATYVRRRLRQLVHASSGLEVEDLVQETLLAVHAKWHTYQPERPFAPWLAAVARHKLVDALRRRHLHLPLDDFENLAAETTAPETAPSVERLLSALPEAQRSALRLTRLEDRSLAETARLLGKSEGAIKQLLHRGMETLRRKAGS